MFPTINYRWKCPKCDKKISGSIEINQSAPQMAQKCPNCGSEMKGEEIIKRGPFPDNPFKK